MADLGVGTTSWSMWQASDQSGNTFDVGGVIDSTGAMATPYVTYTEGLTFGEGALYTSVYATDSMLTCNIVATNQIIGTQIIANGADMGDLSWCSAFDLVAVGDAFVGSTAYITSNVITRQVFTGFLNPYDSIMDPTAVQTYTASTSNVWQFNWLSKITPYAKPGKITLYYGSNSSGSLRSALDGVDYPLVSTGGALAFIGYKGTPNDIYSGSSGCVASNVWLTYVANDIYVGKAGSNVLIHSGNIANYAGTTMASNLQWTTATQYVPYACISGTPTLATVATSGQASNLNYSSLTQYIPYGAISSVPAVYSSNVVWTSNSVPSYALSNVAYSKLTGAPALSALATQPYSSNVTWTSNTVPYSSLSGVPSIPASSQWTTVNGSNISYSGTVNGGAFSGNGSALTNISYSNIIFPAVSPVYGWVPSSTSTGPVYFLTGSVGIGTSSPAGLLTVWCPNNGTGVEISAPTNTGNGSQPFLYFKRYNGSGTVSTTASIMSGGYDGAGGLTFGTNGASTAMIINAAGNVGIGTTSPSSKLHINGGTQTLTNGDSSYTIYGPNTTYSGYLTVGSAIGAQNGTAHAMVCCDNGNLHLSAGNATGTCVYLNYYSQSGSIQSWSPWTHHSTLSCGALYASTVSSSTQYVANGNTSYTQYGPNSTWGAYLLVGAGDPTPWVSTGASVATTNGNLHLDSKTGCAIYLNWYATSTSINSKTYWTHNDSMNITGSLVTGGNVATMANDSAFGYPIAGGQTTALQAYNTVGWIGGAFTGTGGGDRVVIGNLSGNGYIGAHNHALTAWAVLVVNNATVYSASDVNLKENIEAADTQICYDSIKSVPLVRFNYNSNIAPGLITEDKRVTGILAQDLEIIFPKSVRVIDSGSNIYPTDGMKSINLDQVNYTMIGAVQQLMGMVESLTSNVSVLSARITALSG